MFVIKTNSMSMESLMSSLMARATGKSTEEFVVPATHHGAQGLLAEETLYAYSTALQSSSDVRYLDDEYAETSGMESPSYIPLYGDEGYVSSPSYVRGDFYNLSPPVSPNLHSVPATDSSSSHRLSFSIDAILGPRDSSRDSCDSDTDVPAQVFSAFSAQEQYFIEDAGTRLSSSYRTTTPSKLYWCHVCENFCCDLKDAQKHQEIHSFMKDNCRLQSSLFLISGYVIEHAQTSSSSRLQCGLCERIVTYRFFKRHLQCHECSTCSVCRLQFSSEYHLHDHMNAHYGYTPYTCDVCSQQFSSKSGLRNHSRKHLSSGLTCTSCHKTFKTKTARARHERTHERSLYVTGHC